MWWGLLAFITLKQSINAALLLEQRWTKSEKLIKLQNGGPSQTKVEKAVQKWLTQYKTHMTERTHVHRRPCSTANDL